MKTSLLRAMLSRLMNQPTAPFHEDAVRSEILSVLAGFPDVQTKIDGFGNVLAQYRRGDATAPFVLCAHMDHPAYVGGEFLGGVPESYLKRMHPVRSHGAFSMWDLPPYEEREGCVYSRACDDLVGCAVMLATLAVLSEKTADGAVSVLFTRAEEVGLLGAVYAAKSGFFSEDTAFLSLETSAERPPAAMHQGVVIRVGDKTSVFDSQLVSSLTALAQREKIPHQRCLMPGGTCEATAFQLYGYRAAGLCVPLGNYHNCAPSGEIGPEYVSFVDVEAMLELCLAAVLQGVDSSRSDADLRRQLEAKFESMTQRHGGLAPTPQS
jgi:putative aminopeptidase FrvX